MKATRNVALLGLVLLGCLSEIVMAQHRARCGMYQLTGRSQLACPRNYEPVCGTDNVTYPNECSLCREILRHRAIDKKHDGRCVKLDCTGHLRSSSGQAMPCTMEYMPVCGTNGVTYSNKCKFCNAVANGLNINLRHVGQCFQPAVPGQRYHWEDQPGTTSTEIDCGDSQEKGSNPICTADYNPLCGSDGRTYGNKCQFCNAVSRSQGTLFLRHFGEC